MRKVEIRIEKGEAFFERGRRVARLADQSAPIPPSRIVAFENVELLLHVLTAKRVSLLKQVRQAPESISGLARKLKRDRSAVTRDVQLLQSYGVLEVTEKLQPGHGRQKWITSVASDLQLFAHF
jgi:predicted transcriptional regulator